MTPCVACGLLTAQRHCHFCRKTIALIRAGRCVSCTAIVFPGVGERIEGRCANCASRNNRLSTATRKLLRQAASVRAMTRLRAAA